MIFFQMQVRGREERDGGHLPRQLRGGGAGKRNQHAEVWKFLKSTDMELALMK